MKPEQLKQIAEGMGLVVSVRDDKVIIYDCDYGNEGGILADPYNPLTNNDQMVEIMEKLGMDIDYIKANVGARVHSTRLWSTGKTINEAICNAAYEYFKEE